MTVGKKSLGANFGSIFWKASVFSIASVVFSQTAFSLIDSPVAEEGGGAEQRASSEEESAPDILNRRELNSRLKVGASYAHQNLNPVSEEPAENLEKLQIVSYEDETPPQEESAVQEEPSDQEMSTALAASPVELNSRLQIGANYTYLNFRPHGHHSFNGSLGGLQALYEYRPANRFYGGAQFAWREGSLHGSGEKRSFLYFDVQERFGYTFAFEKNDLLLTLFSGFAYRYSGQTLYPRRGRSLKFGYNEFYFPVGLMGGYDINSWVCIGLDFTWMPQVYPTVSIVPLKGARWVITDRLDNFYVAVPFTFTLMKDERFLLTVKPSYQRWEDGHSTARLPNGTSLGLPGNSYNFYGADVNFAYCF